MTRFVFALLLGLSLASGAWAGQTDYMVGAQDVLTITVYDQADLSGKFKVEADGTFTFPLIGRVKAAGTDAAGRSRPSSKTRLSDGYLKNPQVTVAIETYPEPADLRDGRSACARQLSADWRHDAHRGARARRIDHATGRATKS